MNRKRLPSLVLGASLLAAPAAPAPPVPAAADVVADTGIVTLGPNQVLRVTAFTVLILPYIEQDNVFKLRRTEYSAAACASGVCPLSVASQTTTPPLTVPPGGAVTLDVPAGSAGSRVALLSAGRGARLTAQVVDATTGQIICVLIGL
jgi:hypothetical protein